ncbi:hypothetical protein L1889_08045 [Paenalcaligenes niemegkensis]|uniref:hypothetical protein n=1 Tax=Paenalcaligenes niemegkensis TaxID=2895469 RepID=UPI001EE8D9A9|nr:hypothetical protein [Paenalcaligenes niemegkensis]MCQ9616667.1 hypothetical protein [Paenalcaligenes niemegkensis]
MRPITMAELDEVRESCRKLVSRRALLSAAAAVVPIPGVDLSTDVAILLQILPRINEKFGLSAEQVEKLSPELQKLIVVGGASFSVGLLGKVITPSRVISLLKSLGAKRLAGKYATKYVPVIGAVVASTISYVVLKRVGNKHIDECYHIAARLISTSAGDNSAVSDGRGHHSRPQSLTP